MAHGDRAGADGAAARAGARARSSAASLAQVVGLRHAFLVTSGFYVVALVLVFVMYREPPTRTAGDVAGAPGP